MLRASVSPYDLRFAPPPPSPPRPPLYTFPPPSAQPALDSIAWGSLLELTVWDQVYGFDMSVIKEIALTEPLVDVVEGKVRCDLCPSPGSCITTVGYISNTTLVFGRPYLVWKSLLLFLFADVLSRTGSAVDGLNGKKASS